MCVLAPGSSDTQEGQASCPGGAYKKHTQMRILTKNPICKPVYVNSPTLE